MTVVFLILSVLIWIAAVLLVAVRWKRIYPVHILLMGTFLSAALLFVPIYIGYFDSDPAKTVLISLHNALRLFVLDGDFAIIQDHAKIIPEVAGNVFSVWAAALYIFAPILTFGFVLSFFKNLSAYRRYLLGYWRDAYIFSTLNDRSIALAQSIRAKFPGAMIVFTGEGASETGDGFADRAKRMDAICFKKDIMAVNLFRHGQNTKMQFFMMSEDDATDTEHALALIWRFRMREHTRLYVFSDCADTEMLIRSATEPTAGNGTETLVRSAAGSATEKDIIWSAAGSATGGADAKIKVFRIDEALLLIYHCLYEHSIFANAVLCGDEKLISAVIVGLGKYGTEMLKSLCWCGQMNGYRLMIHAFDEDEAAASRFAAECPELLMKSDHDTPGEAQYSIRIHSGMDCRTSEFSKALSGLPAATFAFVAIGSDAENIDAALHLRMLFERQGHKPDILTTVYSAVKAQTIRDRGLTNFKNQDYGIKVIGDTLSVCSYEYITNSELEQEALKRHMQWGGQAKDFYNSGYNYRSSMASVLHDKWRRECGMNAEDLPELEHKRWNAYMRSCGYMYSGSPDKMSRNDLAKMHHDLVPFGDLSEEDMQKDIRMTDVGE